MTCKILANKREGEWEFLVDKEREILDGFIRFVFEGWENCTKSTRSLEGSASSQLRVMAYMVLGFYISEYDFKLAMARVGIPSLPNSTWGSILHYYVPAPAIRSLSSAASCVSRNIKSTDSHQKYFENSMYRRGKKILDHRLMLIATGVIDGESYHDRGIKDNWVAYNKSVGRV